jgi:hypothetical protein
LLHLVGNALLLLGADKVYETEKVELHFEGGWWEWEQEKVREDDPKQ